MFEENKQTAKSSKKPAPLKRNREYRQVSSTVVVSCYVASAAIVFIAVSEALKAFGANDARMGGFYTVLAVLGALFSVFITIMNNRNKKLLERNKNQKGKKIK